MADSDLNVPNPRSVNITGLVDGDFLRFDLTDQEFKRTPPATFVAQAAAITAATTDATAAKLTDVQALRVTVNALLTNLIASGFVKAS